MCILDAFMSFEPVGRGLAGCTSAEPFGKDPHLFEKAGSKPWKEMGEGNGGIMVFFFGCASLHVDWTWNEWTFYMGMAKPACMC